MAYLSTDQLKQLGLKAYGENVKISCHASIYGAENISIGSNVRIDDFCILSAGENGISIGSHIHIAAYSSLIGRGHIEVQDFSNISGRVSVYSSSDDYSGEFMTNPTVPSKFTGVMDDDVTICRHVIIGSGTVILPGVTLEDGVAIGALSLVKSSCKQFGIYAGVPVKQISQRKKNILDLEQQLIASRPHS